MVSLQGNPDACDAQLRILKEACENINEVSIKKLNYTMQDTRSWSKEDKDRHNTNITEIASMLKN